ncbi:probable phospholipid-transporting ATPase IF [Drosophila guanche]|uniref:Phospholipid-transporting ATPase n=1 Tax=Drosophila guanche TaxID=7266 RepID=A0A3B0KS81_DROGU|nr:probable phospholipid-transporting ATPase IF [Drosophila guanche]SPP88766.1 blast:Probable phospholipid-transporting ATPase IF [Drosophila guanche]
MGASRKQLADPLRIQIGGGGLSGGKQALNRVTTTKYNWLTFLPLNLYEQFRRAVYFYFLIITIISFFVNDTISPMVSLIPLLFVMVITALKEGLEDLARSRSDTIVNTARVTVIRNGQEQCIESQFVVPGDLVVVSSNGDIPCDLVLLQSSGMDNKCFVTTANLDGESNLKTVFAPTNYTLAMEGCIVCEAPRPDLYSFNGRLELEGDTLPLTLENLLLRGVRVKDTARIVGCAIYTGMHTKLQLNSRYTGNKSASSEKYINRFMVALILGMIVVVVGLYMIERHKEAHVVATMPYLGPPSDFNSFWQIFEDFLSFLLLFNYMVPISAYMNIELYRIAGAHFMQSDLQLYDEETDQPCQANASNLNEELGQVNILFSDKTGTLTKNLMNFLKCYVDGRDYHLQGAQLYSPATDEKLELATLETQASKFFEALTICHTVELQAAGEAVSSEAALTERSSLMSTGNVVGRYQASSPDEKALLEGCANLGLVYEGCHSNQLRIRRYPAGEALHYERLHVLEFSSERKRMSVIVRDGQGAIWLYSKGAESIIFPRCHQSPELSRTDAQITEYARQGLRTLAVARRRLTAEAYTSFMAQYRHANTQLTDRTNLIAECYETVETGLDLLGATALEDALQDNVGETLVALRTAGLKIWVLTGDKVETAFNIGLACQHIPPGATVHYMVNVTERTELLLRLKEIEAAIGKDSSQEALVIDGVTVASLLAHAPKQFADVALKCRAVLCCRLSPLQKSEIVTLIKRRKKNHITAAIGDGANDVSMIQEAHIGIGITGREGKQAARCADYAIAKFEMLQRLLLVHGHYNSQRLAFLVLFYCYKNIIITGCMALFQVYDLYSATNVYNSLFLWLFDIVYISFSFTILAISDKPYSEETLLRHPELYKRLAHNKQTSWSRFSMWILNGAIQCLIIFYFAYAVLNDDNVVYNVGQTAGFQTFGCMLITIIVIVGNLKLLLVAHYLTYLNFAIIVGSIGAFMLTTYLYNLLTGSELYMVYNLLLGSLPLWLYTIICSVACLLPDFTMKVVKDMLRQPPPLDTQKRALYEEGNPKVGNV